MVLYVLSPGPVLGVEMVPVLTLIKQRLTVLLGTIPVLPVSPAPYPGLQSLLSRLMGPYVDAISSHNLAYLTVRGAVPKGRRVIGELLGSLEMSRLILHSGVPVNWARGAVSLATLGKGCSSVRQGLRIITARTWF
jgi:hypothetical protein